MRLPAGTSAGTIVDATALPCAESDGVLEIKLTCSPASATPWSFRLRTKDGSATAPGDYTAVDRVETMAAGETERIVSIPITADTELESTGFFEVELSAASPSVVLPVTRVVATIRATSVDLLPPAPVHQPVPAAAPHRVYLANGTLLQFNQRTETSSVRSGSPVHRAAGPDSHHSFGRADATGPPHPGGSRRNKPWSSSKPGAHGWKKAAQSRAGAPPVFAFSPSPRRMRMRALASSRDLVRISSGSCA